MAVLMRRMAAWCIRVGIGGSAGGGGGGGGDNALWDGTNTLWDGTDNLGAS
jgi:hypothetical protein